MDNQYKTSHQQGKKQRSSVKRWLSALGPGIITAALVFGPGSLTITSKMGAMYGYTLLWLIMVAIFFMIIFTEMGARIGITTEASLLTIIKNKWGRAASIMLGIGIFLITASFQAGNTIGASLAFAELFHSDTGPWVFVFTLVAIALLFFKSFYKILEKLMMLLVGLMLISFFITLLLSSINFSALLKGLFVPAIPEGAEILSIALVASSFSIVGAFYQSYLVREKGLQTGEAKQGTRESIAGILILGVISSFILINAASILYPQGIQVNSATDMGLALAPLYGNIATVIFMLGLFGASFSSLIGNATIGGSLLSDAFSLGNQLSSRVVRLMILMVILLGATIALIFGELPLELIIFAQAITILIAPLVGIALLFIANDKKTMGKLKNTVAQNVAGVLGLSLLLLLSLAYARLLFFT